MQNDVCWLQQHVIDAIWVHSWTNRVRTARVCSDWY